jgi:hypothetical protein
MLLYFSHIDFETASDWHPLVVCLFVPSELTHESKIIGIQMSAVKGMAGKLARSLVPDQV